MSFFIQYSQMDHLSYLQLEKILSQTAKQIPVGSKREHYKTPGKYYEVKDLVIDEVSDEVCVIYGIIGSNVQFARLAKIFLESVLYPDGNIGSRFIQID